MRNCNNCFNLRVVGIESKFNKDGKFVGYKYTLKSKDISIQHFDDIHNLKFDSSVKVDFMNHSNGAFQVVSSKKYKIFGEDYYEFKLSMMDTLTTVVKIKKPYYDENSIYFENNERFLIDFEN